VTTYGEIARALGKPGAARAVGNALNKNNSSSVPCHRVVRSDETIGGFARGTRTKKELLEKEGVRVKGNKVDLKRCCYILFLSQVATNYSGCG
jgi:O-6-methylguanine DNA methyltransferase